MKHPLVKFFALTLVVFASQLLSWSSLYAETEPNNSSTEANQLTLGVIGDTNATLSSSADIDWYKIDLQEDHWYVFETYNVSPQLDSILKLYSTDGTTLLESGDGSGTGDTQDRFVWQAPANATYYLRVASYSGQGTYSVRALLHYNEGGAWNWDNNKPHEPNDSWQTAYSINVGRENAVQTTIYPRGAYKTVGGDSDYFRFTATLGHWYVIETFNTDTTLDTTLKLYDNSGTTELDSGDGNGIGNSQDKIVWRAPATGIYYIRVSPYSSSAQGTYSLRILPHYSEGASWTSSEPNDSWVTAIPITLNEPHNGNLYQVGNYKTTTADNDYFYFVAESGYDYTIDLTNVASTLDAKLYLLSLDGETQLASKTGSVGTSRSLTYKITTPGLYYVLVKPYSSSSNNTGNYQLTVSTQGNSSLQVSEEVLSFFMPQDSTYPETGSFVVGNGGSGSLNWTISTDKNWLQISPTSGSANSPTVVTVTPNISGLPATHETANITISGNGITKIIRVTLRVGAVVSPISEVEPNTNINQAVSLPIGSLRPVQSHLSSKDDIDWYQISVETGHWYTFETFNVSKNLDSQLKLYDTNGTTLLKSADGGGTGDSQDRLIWQAPTNGNYYLRVSSYSGQGMYSIHALPKYDEGATWSHFYNPNDNWQTAYPISVGVNNALQTTIYPHNPYKTVSGDEDYFRVELSLGQWYLFETFNVDPILDTTLTLYDNSGTKLLDNGDGNGKGNSQDMIVWQAPANGTYYLKVAAYSDIKSGSYSLRVLPQGGPNLEPNDSWITAIPLVVNQAHNGNLYQVGNYKTVTADWDYFSFAAEAGYDYTLDLTNVATTLDANLSLLSLDGKTVLATKTGTVGTSRTLTYKIATNGIYYILVKPYSSSSNNVGTYQLQVTTNAPQTTYTISGKVTDSNGAALTGVILTTNLGQTATTDNQGNYTFSNLAAGSYTLTPSKTGYTFNPASLSVNLSSNVTGQNFVGTTNAANTYTISGKVTDSNGAVLAGVTLTTNLGQTATTDNQGNYTLSNLTAGSYTLTPSKTGYTFNPASLSVNLSSNVTGQNFVGTTNAANTYTISGKVTDSSGAALAGVTLTTNLGQTAVTDNQGNYTLGNLVAGSYTLTPSKAGYIFNIPSLLVFLSSNMAGQNFVGTSDQKLAEKYAPVIYLHEDEVFRPNPIDVMLKNARYREQVDFDSDKNITDKPTELRNLYDKYEEKYFLDLYYDCKWKFDDDCSSNRAAGEHKNQYKRSSWRDKYHTYARVERKSNQTVIQYWLFYYYNDGVNNHEGDWEMIQVVLDSSNTPEYMGYANHESGTKRLWSNVQKKNEHPIVYVAWGSHASYFSLDLYNHRTDHTGTNKQIIPTVELIKYPDTSKSFDKLDDNETSWLRFAGHWGERDFKVGDFAFDSPTGPSTKGTKWTDPISWGDVLEWDVAQYNIKTCTSSLDKDVYYLDGLNRFVGYDAQQGKPISQVENVEYLESCEGEFKRCIVYHNVSGLWDRYITIPEHRYIINTDRTTIQGCGSNRQVDINFPIITVSLPYTPTGEIVTYTLNGTSVTGDSVGRLSSNGNNLALLVDNNNDGNIDQTEQATEIGRVVVNLDSIPPAQVVDLQGEGKSLGAILHWTAPGDDGNNGTATSYDLRYSTEPLTESNWEDAFYTDIRTPSQGGMTEQIEVFGIQPGQIYFGLVAHDELRNKSQLSNVISIRVFNSTYLPLIIK